MNFSYEILLRGNIWYVIKYAFTDATKNFVDWKGVELTPLPNIKATIPLPTISTRRYVYSIYHAYTDHIFCQLLSASVCLDLIPNEQPEVLLNLCHIPSETIEELI